MQHQGMRSTVSASLQRHSLVKLCGQQLLLQKLAMLHVQVMSTGETALTSPTTQSSIKWKVHPQPCY